MSSLLMFTPWIGGACCCLAFFVLLMIIATFLFRSKRSKPEDIDGLPAAPASGQQTRASLTMLEYEPTQRTPRPGPPRPEVEAQTSVMDRGGQPARASLPPPPPPPPGTITRSPSLPARSPRMLEPTPTVAPAASQPPPLPKRGDTE